MTRAKRSAALAVVVVVFGLVWLATSRRDSSPTTSAAPSQTRLFTVRKGTLQLGIRTTGSLRPRDYQPVPSQLSGKIEWLIDEGARVKKGDTIARVEDVEYREELESAELNLSIVKADLVLEELKRDYTVREGQHASERADIALKLAQLEEELLGEPSATDIHLSELDVELKRLRLEAARRDSERLQGLARKGIVDQRQLSVARLKLEGARVAHEKALLEHKLLLAPTPEVNLVVARQRVKRASTALDLAEKKKERDLNLCKTAIRVAQASVDRYNQTIDVQRRRVMNAEVKATRAGTIIYPRPWGTPRKVGDAIWRGNRILDIADLDTMVVEGLVNQVDWPKVKVGQDVEIILTAAPNRKFTGKVTEVGGLAIDRYLMLGGDVTGVMTFRVNVLINEESPLLQPTYSAHLNIIIAEYKDVCYVRRTAVGIDEEGNPFVRLRPSRRSVKRRVKLGAGDAVNVVVVEGLEPGDVIEVPDK